MVDPCNDPLFNPNYPGRSPWTDSSNSNTNNGVVLPWCGGVENLGKIYMPLGGGHADYGGNEPYVIDINDDEPAWVMIRPPSGSVPLIAGGLPAGSTPKDNSYLLADGLESSGVYADGRPRAIHSYNGHCYVPGVGIVLPACGGHYLAPMVNARTMIMDIATGEWDIKEPPHSGVGDPLGSASCYDSTRGYVVYMGAGNGQVLSKIDVVTGARTQHSAYTIGSSGDIRLVFIKEFDIIFQTCGYFTRKFCIHDAATGVITQPLITGATMPTITGSTGCDWVPGLGMVFLTNTSGELYVLAPTGDPKVDPWECSMLSSGGAATSITVGMYGKFGYSAKLKGLFRVAQAGIPVWFFATE